MTYSPDVKSVHSQTCPLQLVIDIRGTAARQ
jgi:hypothetical protein